LGCSLPSPTLKKKKKGKKKELAACKKGILYKVILKNYSIFIVILHAY
jgi:hypothetical protein